MNANITTSDALDIKEHRAQDPVGVDDDASDPKHDGKHHKCSVAEILVLRSIDIKHQRYDVEIIALKL